MINLFLNQPTSLSAEIKRNIKWAVWGFIGTIFALIIALLVDYFALTSIPFGIIVFPFIILLTYSIIRVNTMHCPECGKKLGLVYGMFPFVVIHDFDLENCKHCHFDLTLPFES